MKKIITYLVCLVLLCSSSLAGCSSNKKKEVAEPWESGKKLNQEKLTIYFNGQEPVTVQQVKKELEKKAKNTLNIKLSFKTILDTYSYRNTIESVIKSGQPLDAFMININEIPTLAVQEQIKDISRLVENYMPNYYNNFSREQISAASYNGKIMGVPHNNLPAVNKIGLYVLTDFINKYDFPKIKELSDLDNMLATFKKNECKVISSRTIGDINYIQYDFSPLSRMNLSTLELMAEKSGYFVLDEDLGLVYRQNDKKMKLLAWDQTPEYKTVLNIMGGWQTKGYKVSGSSILQIGFAASSGRDMNRTYEYEKMDLFPAAITQRSPNVQYVMAFSKNSKVSERCLMFFEWLQKEKECYDLVRYGIKGKDYKLDSYGKPSVPAFETYDVVFPNWGGTKVFYNYKNEQLNNKDTKAYLNKLNRTSIFPYHIGFHIDYDRLNEELNKRQLFRSFLPEEQKYLMDPSNGPSIDELINKQKDAADFTVAFVQQELNDWLQKTKSGK